MGNYNPNVEASVDHVETIEVKKINLDLTVGFDDDHEFRGTIYVYFHEFGDGRKQIVSIMDHDAVWTPEASEHYSWASILLDALNRFMNDDECVEMKLEVLRDLLASEQIGYMEWCDSVPEDFQTQMEDHLKSEGLQI